MKITPAIRIAAKPMPPFIKPLRNANRKGRKTQTRRTRGLDVINEKPGNYALHQYTEKSGHFTFRHLGNGKFVTIKFPYGKKGDIRYLLEPLEDQCKFTFYADDGKPVRRADGGVEPWKWQVKRLSQLHLPKKYARTFFRILGFGCERVKDITERAAKAEGIIAGGLSYPNVKTHRDAFLHAFEAINGESDLTGAGSPWVWFIRYELL